LPTTSKGAGIAGQGEACRSGGAYAEKLIHRIAAEKRI
jgi:hypothetical protein